MNWRCVSIRKGGVREEKASAMGSKEEVEHKYKKICIFYIGLWHDLRFDDDDDSEDGYILIFYCIFSYPLMDRGVFSHYYTFRE